MATVSPSGKYSVIFDTIGTKALLLRGTEIVRQLNRDFYHAHAYAYPITFAMLPDGRELLIHCPENYCQLEIEEVESGRSLSQNFTRDSADFFHSRLIVSNDGRWLLSAGWVWHPLDIVAVYKLSEAMEDARVLDSCQTNPPGSWESSSAAFVDNGTVAVGTSDEFFGDDDDESDLIPGKNAIGIWKIGSSSYETAMCLEHPPGTMMPLNHRFIVTFYGHPRLYDLEKQQLVHEWLNIDSGIQRSNITFDKLPPPLALDAKNARFAVADQYKVTMIQIDIEVIQ